MPTQSLEDEWPEGQKTAKPFAIDGDIIHAAKLNCAPLHING